MRFVPLSEVEKEQPQSPSLRFVPLSEVEQAPAAATALLEPPVTDEELAAASSPVTLNPRLARQGAQGRAAARPNRSVMDEVRPLSFDQPTPAPVSSVVRLPDPVRAVEAQLNAMPTAQRQDAIARLRDDPKYGAAVQEVERRYAALDTAPPTMRRVADQRVEARTSQLIEQGLRPEYAEQQAQIDALRDQPSSLQQATRDVVGEQAGQEAAAQAESLKDAGFWERVGAGTASSVRKSGMGIMLAAADSGVFGNKDQASKNLLNAIRVEGEVGKAVPEGESIFEKSAQGAMTSLAGQAPTMILGVLTGSAAPMLAQAAIQTFGQEYAEGRAAGLSGRLASTRAAPIAAAEVFFERFGMTKALSGLRAHVAANGLDSVPAYVAKSIATEIPSELATTVAQYGIDILPTIGLKKPSLVGLYNELEETLRQTVLQAGATAGVTTGVVKATKAAQDLAQGKRQPYKRDTSYEGLAQRMIEQAGFVPSQRPAAPPAAEAPVTPPTTPPAGPAPQAVAPVIEQPAEVAEPQDQIYESPETVTPDENVSVTPVTLSQPAPSETEATPPLEVYRNEADGTQSRIVQLKDGRYSVTLQDLDSNEVLPNARIFPQERLADAQQFAKKIANLPPDTKTEEQVPAEAKPTPATSGLEPILQNRDRSNPASVAQMRSIAAAPDYGRLGFSRDFANGSPVIAGGEIPAAQLGTKDVAVASDGRRIPVQYAVVDAASILASNAVDGSVNPDYGNKYIAAPRAIAGNGRVAGLQEAYKTGAAEQYKAELADDKLHGISPDVVAGIPNPVLVRVMPASEISADIGDVSNTGGNLALSPVEQAKNDLNRVNFDALEFSENGSLTPDAVRKFIQAMPTAEQGNLIDSNGQPTKQAYERLEAAVFAKAYNNDELIRLFAQAQDPEARLIISALAQVAPDMARLEGAGALDIRDIVVDGAKTIINAKIRGIKLQDAAKQADLDMLPDARIVVELFSKNPRSNKAAIEALRKAANFAYDEANKPSEDMFGAVEKAGREQVLQKLEGKDEEGGQENVAEAARSRVTAANAKGRGTQPGAADLFEPTEKGGAAKDFELTGETAAETKARLAKQEREREEKERKAIADKERDLFALTPPPAPERKTPPSGDLFAQAPAKEETTKEQRAKAEEFAKQYHTEIVWQKGNFALARGYSDVTGDPVYLPVNEGVGFSFDVNAKLSPTSRFLLQQIMSTKDGVSGKRSKEEIEKILQEMKAQSKTLEADAAKKHAEAPFILFDNGIALSEDIPQDLAGVIREWKDLLNLGVNIYVSTREDAKKNRNNFTGPHRRIGSGTVKESELGSMRRMEEGSYYILFTKSTNMSKMLETIAHEMGHVHQRLHYDNASETEKQPLREAHAKWVANQKGKTARELVNNLRSRSAGKLTLVPAGLNADQLRPYWTSFNEWYADQTARWAVSAKQPTTIVEKFFRRLGVALRKFYQSLKAQKYLPNETFVQFLEKTMSRPVDLTPGNNSPEAHAMQNGFDFNEESKIADEIASENSPAAKALHEADKITGTKKRLPPGRSPELAAAAEMVKAGTMSAKDYDKLVNKYQPIATWTEAKKPATVEQMSAALDANKRDKLNAPVAAGTKVGLRLDIPSARRGASVVTIHDKNAAGKTLSYGSVGKITNVTFGAGSQQQALKIATGEGKDAIQAMQGSWVPITPEQATDQINAVMNDPSWTQVGIDPTRHAYFYDRFTTMPVIAADEVIQIGNQVVAKNVTYGKKENFLFNIESPSHIVKPLTKDQTRKEQIAAYAGLRRRMATLMKQVSAGNVSINLQRTLNELQEASEELKSDIDAGRVASVSPENFMAKALQEYDKGNISADVLGVIQAAFNKYPQLLQDLRLSVRKPLMKNGQESNAAGSFATLSRIVALYKSTSGTEDPKTIRHELTHSLEQMMTSAQLEAVAKEWVKAIGKAIKKHKDQPHQKFFEAIFAYTEKPTEANKERVIELLPSYEMYQYVNPSEYWAVNAEKLMASQLGTPWQRFKLMVRRLFEGLKNVLGFDNKYATHRTFSQIMNGDLRRLSRTMLSDLIESRENYGRDTHLSNIKDDEDLKRKYNRPNTPLMKQTSAKQMILNGVTAAKQMLQLTASYPLGVANFVVTGIDRGITHQRNKNVFYGTGLSLADQARYSGQVKTASNLATASLALDNAIRAATIVPEVIFRGGIAYNPKTKVFQAVNRAKGMAGVYKAESKLKAKLGDQLGSDIIQGYLEAKRSRSINEEAIKREEEVQLLEANLALLRKNPSAKPADIKLLQNELEEAQQGVEAIKIAMQKVRMSEQEINDFIDRESAHPELGDIMENWNAINQNMLAFNRQVGLLSQSRYDVLASIQDYVPWQRVMEDADTISSKLKTTIRSMTNIGREPKFKKGEPRVITTFVAEDGQQTFKVQPASKIQVEIEGNKVPASQLDIKPNGEVTIKAPVRAGDLVVFTTNREIQNMIDNMTQSVMRMTINGLRQYAATRIVEEYATRNEKNKLLVFPKVNLAEGHYNYKLNGKDVVIEIKDPLIAESLLGMEAMGFRMFAGLSAAANLFRRSITLSGAFQLKQVFKDAPSAAFVSGVKRPEMLLAGVFKGFVGALTTTDPAYKILKANGIGGFQSLARTPEKEIKQRLGVMNRNAWQFTMKALDHWGDASDMAQRLATYNRVMAETNDEALALFRAQNVINFQRHGSGQIAQFLAKTTPFINAWAQSIDTTFQALAGGGLKGKNRAAAVARMAQAGAMLSFMTLVYCMMVGDDEEYAELDDMTRLNNYIIPGTKITLPMNTSVAFFFKALPELAYNYIMKQSTETAMDERRLRRALKEAAMAAFLGPTPVPSVAKPFLEIGIKHDFFTGRPVVPDSLAKLEATEQYTAATSELAKMLSSAMSVDGKAPLSPIEIDHLVRGLFGTAGAMAQWSSNLIGQAAENRPAMTAKEQPFIGPFLRPEVPRGPEDVYYDFKEVVEQKYGTWKKMIDRSDFDAADAYLDKNGDVAAFHKYIEKTDKTLAKLNKQIRYLGETKDKFYTPSERRQEMEEFQRIKNEVLRPVYELRKQAGL